MKPPKINPLDTSSVNCSCSMFRGIDINAIKEHLNQARSWTYRCLAVMQKVAYLRSQKGIIHRDEVCEYKLTKSEIDEMLAAVNGESNNFANRLKNRYKLKEHMIVFCCLLLFKLSNQEIKALLDIEEPAIKKRKQRLKRIFFKPPYEGEPEDFLINFQDRETEE